MVSWARKGPDRPHNTPPKGHCPGLFCRVTNHVSIWILVTLHCRRHVLHHKGTLTFMVAEYSCHIIVRSPFRVKHPVVVQYMARWMKLFFSGLGWGSKSNIEILLKKYYFCNMTFFTCLECFVANSKVK